jgi:hypothetical protein
VTGVQTCALPILTLTYHHKGQPVTKLQQLEEREYSITMAQILKMFYVCPFMCQVIAATNYFQISWNPFLFNIFKRAIWKGKFQVESDSVLTS